MDQIDLNRSQKSKRAVSFEGPKGASIFKKKNENRENAVNAIGNGPKPAT